VVPQALAFTPSGKELVLGDMVVRVWDLDKREQVREFKGDKGMASALAVSPDGKLLAAVFPNAKVWIWDLKTLKAKAKLALPAMPAAGLSFTADSGHLAAGHTPWSEQVKDKDGKVTFVLRPAKVVVWDVKSAREVRRLEGLAHPRFLPDGKTILAQTIIEIGPNWKLAYVDVGDWSVRKTDINLGHRPALAADGKLAAAVHTDGLWLSTLPDGKRLLDLPGHETPVGCLAVSPDGRFLASGHGMSTMPVPSGYALHIWDTVTAKHVTRLVGGEASASAAAFSPDGRELAAAGVDGVVRVWDVPGWKLRKEVALPVLKVAKMPPATSS